MQIEIQETRELDAVTRSNLFALFRAAYEEDLEVYLDDIGDGTHALGRVGRELVSHAMFVPRALYPGSQPTLRTAYVELVATHPREQGRGYASELLQHLTRRMTDFDLAALSPSDEAIYTRLGWETWRGPLAIWTSSGFVPTPDESVMILRLDRTPLSLDVNAALSVDWRPGEVW